MNLRKLQLAGSQLVAASEFLKQLETSLREEEAAHKELLATVDRISSNYADAKDSVKEMAKVLGDKVGEIATLKQQVADLTLRNETLDTVVAEYRLRGAT